MMQAVCTGLLLVPVILCTPGYPATVGFAAAGYRSEMQEIRQGLSVETVLVACYGIEVTHGIVNFLTLAIPVAGVESMVVTGNRSKILARFVDAVSIAIGKRSFAG
jgi:hypothetical protein